MSRAIFAMNCLVSGENITVVNLLGNVMADELFPSWLKRVISCTTTELPSGKFCCIKQHLVS